jgi:uncharacterized protein YciI
MQFIYVLRLIPRLIIEANWTQEDNDFVGHHFSYLKSLKEKGCLLLAGKTDGLDQDTFGLVLFESNSIKEAQDIMEKDPAIVNGIMTGTLFPYNVALWNENYKK